jgi:WD40 repeat protein
LWPTIEKALAAADWFVLLASPEAAKSPWVEKEVDFWRRNKSPERLLIVQTDGEIAWDHATHDFDWTQTTALPRRLSAVFPDEPRWIDARWARTADQATLRDPRFRDLVAELAAPLRGVPKDELIGEDIRQHRRLNLWRNAALAVVTMLLIGAIAAAAIAIKQREEAQRNQSRALVVLAGIEADAGSPATAIRLALAAMPEGTAPIDYGREAEGPALHALQQLREFRRVGPLEEMVPVAFSPDGRTLATAAKDMVRLWEAATAKEIATLRSQESLVFSVAFSPDGRTLATGSDDNTTRLWEVASGVEIAALRGHEEGPEPPLVPKLEGVTSIVFSPDGRMLATGADYNTTRLWEVASGREIAVLRGHEERDKQPLLAKLEHVTSVAFSPDGRTLATGSADNTARLWEVATAREIATLRGHDDQVSSVTFSPDGRTLATGSWDNTARLWEVASAEEITTLRGGHERPVDSLAFSPDGGILATGSTDRTVRLWDVVTAKEIVVLRGHQEGVGFVAFSPDGRTLATGSSDKTVRLWEVGSLTRGWLGVSLEPVTQEVAVRSSLMKPEGALVASVIEGSPAAKAGVRQGDVVVGFDGTLVPTPRDLIRAVADSPLHAKRTLTVWRDNREVRIDVRLGRQVAMGSGKDITTLRGHEGSVMSVAFSPDGRGLATGSADTTTRLWEVASGKEIATLRGHQNIVTSVAFSPGGRILATGSWDNTARLLGTGAGKVPTLRGHELPVASVAFSPDGLLLATGSFDKTVRLWDVATANEIATLRGHEKWVNAVAFSPDGRTLASASLDETARLWEVATAEEIAIFRHEATLSSVAFSPDSRVLATGSADGARLWEVASGKKIATLLGHQHIVTRVAFSPDGRTLATGSYDKTARLWEVATAKEIASLRGHQEAVEDVAFSPDGRTLATGSGDKTVRLWPVGQALMERACARVHFLPLLEKDKQRFGISEEWCTREVSAALRAKLGLDEAGAN